MKAKLRDIYNNASFVLYALNEGMQLLTRKGYHIYDALPGGKYINFYMGSFAGAAALAYVLKLNRRFLQDLGDEAIVATSTLALTGWELTHIHNRFDWNDMGFYALALTGYYLLNKEFKQTPHGQPLKIPSAPQKNI